MTEIGRIALLLQEKLMTHYDKEREIDAREYDEWQSLVTKNNLEGVEDDVRPRWVQVYIPKSNKFYKMDRVDGGMDSWEKARTEPYPDLEIVGDYPAKYKPSIKNAPKKGKIPTEKIQQAVNSLKKKNNIKEAYDEDGFPSEEELDKLKFTRVTPTVAELVKQGNEIIREDCKKLYKKIVDLCSSGCMDCSIKLEQGHCTVDKERNLTDEEIDKLVDPEGLIPLWEKEAQELFGFAAKPLLREGKKTSRFARRPAAQKGEIKNDGTQELWGMQFGSDGVKLLDDFTEDSLEHGVYDDETGKITIFDNVNAPKHYLSHPAGVECIEITEHYDFCVGNAIKYLWRAGIKSENPLEDLRKAAWYVERKIKLLEKDTNEQS